MLGKKNCIFVKIIFAMALLCFWTMPFSAFAYNADYMLPEKWNSKNVVSADFVKNGADGKIGGTYKYFLDNDDGCFYICLNVDKSDSEIVPENIKVGFNITDGAETYSFAADQNGMCDSTDGTAEAFSVQSDFLTYPNLHSGRYICAVNIPKGENSYNFVVSLWNNGRRYIVDENITIKRISTVTKRAERTKSKKSTTAKSTRSTTSRSTKFYAESTSKIGTSKSAARTKSSNTRAAKRKYTGKTAFRADNTGTAVTANSQVYDYSSGREKMTNSSFAFLIVGIVVAVIGVGFIVFAAAKNMKSRSAEESDKKDNDEEFKDDSDFDF